MSFNPIEDIQTLPLVTHVNADGSKIGGSTPLHYAALQGTSPDTSVLFVLSGSKNDNGNQYAVAEWGIKIQLPTLVQPPPKTGNLFLSYFVTFGGTLYAFETDTIITYKDKNGKIWKFVGGSGQLNFNESGRFQINNQVWAWIDANVSVGYPINDVQHAVKIGYMVDLTTAVPRIAIVSYQYDGKLYPIVPVWLNAEPSTWEPNLILTQIQPTLQKNPVTGTALMDHVGYTAT